MSWRMLLTFVVMVLVSPLSPGQEKDPWSGKTVVTKNSTPLRVGDQVVDDGGTFRVYKVERVNGDWLWLVSGSVAGWARPGDVIPYDEAIDY